MSVPQKVTHQPRPKISRKIDSITSLPSETSSNSKNDKEESQRCQITSSNIPIILECINTKHENGTSNKFRKELSCLCHKCGRVCAEDSGGRMIAVTWNGTNV